jgi:cytochrome bd-type quinol oxidase subunit 2
MGSDWEATEERLVARSDERRSRLARRDRRRSVLPWVLAPLVLPALGAAAVLVLVENAGGDFADWSTSEAAAALVALFVVPAVVSAWVARRQGVAEAIAWAFVCVGVQLALVVGVGFLALDLGPS